VDAVTWAHLGILLGVVGQTAALFYWGGKVTRTLEDHDRRLGKLEP
jgi:hypothetical protein